MDKAMILTAILLIATPLVVFTLAIGWMMDDERIFEGKRDSDSDIRIYVPGRDRDRGRNNRHCEQGDEP